MKFLQQPFSGWDGKSEDCLFFFIRKIEFENISTFFKNTFAKICKFACH